MLDSNGTLILYGGGNEDGPWTISSGATINLNLGTYVTTPNGVISGGGQLKVTGASLRSVASRHLRSSRSRQVPSDGPGFLSIGKTFYWDGGTIAGTGGAELAGNGTGVISGVSGPMTLTDRTFNNYGYIAYAVNPGVGNSPLTLTGTAQFNTFGATDINADGSIFGSSGTSLGIFQAGLLEKSSSNGTSTISAPMTNDALVIAWNGTLVIGGNGGHTGTSTPTRVPRLPSVHRARRSTAASIYGPGNIAFLSGSGTEIDGDYYIGGQTSIARCSRDVRFLCVHAGLSLQRCRNAQPVRRL